LNPLHKAETLTTDQAALNESPGFDFREDGHRHSQAFLLLLMLQKEAAGRQVKRAALF
jgi:hypothetical protein